MIKFHLTPPINALRVPPLRAICGTDNPAHLRKQYNEWTPQFTYDYLQSISIPNNEICSICFAGAGPFIQYDGPPFLDEGNDDRPQVHLKHCRRCLAPCKESFCSQCAKRVSRPKQLDGDQTRDVDQRPVGGTLSFFKSAQGKVPLNNECFIHGTDLCGCLPPVYVGELDRVAKPLYTKYPGFSVGVESEVVGPVELFALFSGIMPVGNDGTIRVDGFEKNAMANGWQGAEIRIPTWDIRAPIHAARMTHFLRRFGAHVNHTCGFHVHVDARILPPKLAKKIESRLVKLWVKYQEWCYEMFPARRVNMYCTPVSAGRTFVRSDGHGTTTHWVNVNRSEHNTFEFRLSPATTNFFHAYAWVEFVCWLYRSAIAERDPGLFPRAITALYKIRTERLVSIVDFANFCSRVLRRERFVQGDLSTAIETSVRHITQYILGD